MVVILLLVPSSTSSTSLTTTTTYTNSISISQPKYQIASSSSPSNYRCYGSHQPLAHQSSSLCVAAESATRKNFNREFVNHVTRINISNDYSQVEASSGEPEAVVKEGEYENIFLRAFYRI
jgi:hypothetical protein